MSPVVIKLHDAHRADLVSGEGHPWASPVGQTVKHLPARQETSRRCRFQPWAGKIPWRREWLPTPVFLPGEFDGQRSLAGYSPWGCRESDTTEQLNNNDKGHSSFFTDVQQQGHFSHPSDGLSAGASSPVGYAITSTPSPC